MLTQETLKELVHYNPDTGIFTWRTSSPWRTAGTEIGYEIKATCGKKYRKVRLVGEMYLVHRLAFLYVTGAFPEADVDHENGNGLHNWWDNIRDVPRLENSRNRKLNHNNKSGCTGVLWYPRYGKWVSRIGMKGKKITLGYFIELSDAISARKQAEIKYGFHENHGSTRPL